MPGPRLKLTLLGSGDAAGVPAYGCHCDACQRALCDPAHRRESACALLEADSVRVLIDAGLADLGARFPPGSLDAILLTHFHPDHVQGLFRIRWGRNLRLPVIAPADPNGCADLFKHPGILDFGQPARAFEPFVLGKLTVTPLPLTHSRPTLGYMLALRDQRIAYLTDTCGLPDETEQWLQTHIPSVLILDCSHPPREEPPRNHNDLNLASRIIE